MTTLKTEASLASDGTGYCALENAERILAAMAPDGALTGNEYLLLNPHRPDRDLGSFKVNVVTGAWADFATTDAKGQGLVSLVSYYYRVTPAKARIWLRGALGLEAPAPDTPRELLSLPEDAPVARRASDDWVAGFLPDDRSRLPYAYPGNFMRAAPDQIDEYKDPKGRAYLLVLRWNAGTLGAEKIVRPAVWARPKDDPDAPFRWAPAWPETTWPLHADKIAVRSKASILIVEGEKACRRATDYFPDRIVTCCQKGCDLSVFRKREVIIWPDADEPGARKAQDLAAKLTAAGVGSAAIVLLPSGVPKSWDLGDDLPDGWTPAVVRKLVTRTDNAAVTERPDRLILDLSRGAPPKLDISRILPSWKTWVSDGAVAAGAPPEYVFGALLATAAGMVSGTARIEITESWREPALIYACMIGDSSSGKTPALKTVEEGLMMLENSIVGDYQARVAQWEMECAQTPRNQRTPPQPAYTRVRISDATIEAIAKALADEGRGLLSWQAEAVEWISGLTRFKQNGANDRGFWLKAWDGLPGQVMRRGLGDAPLIIPAQALSIVMAAQPDAILPLLQGPALGLAERFLFLWPEPQKLEHRARSVASGDVAFVHRALDRLFNMGLRHRAKTDPARRFFTARMTDSAYDHFEKWRVDYLRGLREEHGVQIPAALGKAPSHVARIALICHLLEWAAGSSKQPHGIISVPDVQAAIDMWDLFAAHRTLVESDAEEPDQEKLGRSLARWVVRENIEVIEPYRLRKEIRLPGIRSNEAVRMALLELEAAKWLAPGTDIGARDWDKLPPQIAIRDEVSDLIRKK